VGETVGMISAHTAGYTVLHTLYEDSS